jgi:hypothetical protein
MREGEVLQQIKIWMFSVVVTSAKKFLRSCYEAGLTTRWFWAQKRIKNIKILYSSMWRRVFQWKSVVSENRIPSIFMVEG